MHDQRRHNPDPELSWPKFQVTGSLPKLRVDTEALVDAPQGSEKLRTKTPFPRPGRKPS
jgi:hypothetical protein